MQTAGLVMATIQAVLFVAAVVSAYAGPHDIHNFFSSEDEASNFTPDFSPSSNHVSPTKGGVPSSLFGAVSGNPRCGKNEIFLACGSKCSVTCSDYRSHRCHLTGCRPGCFCLDGTVRDDKDDWKCVRPYKCKKHHNHKSSRSSGSSEEHSRSHSDEHHHKKGHKDSDEHHNHKKDKKGHKDSDESNKSHSDKHHHKKDKKGHKDSDESNKSHSDKHHHKKEKKGHKDSDESNKSHSDEHNHNKKDKKKDGDEGGKGKKGKGESKGGDGKKGAGQPDERRRPESNQRGSTWSDPYVAEGNAAEAKGTGGK